MEKITEYLSQNKEWISIVISIITSTVSIIALIRSISESKKEQRKYNESKKPFICFQLKEINRTLFLYISNKGGSAAKLLSVKLVSLSDNGDSGLQPGKLFEHSFDLYPGETISDIIGHSGKNIAEDCTAILSVSFSYFYDNKKYESSRSVIQSRGYDFFVQTSISDSVFRDVTEPLESISRSAVRTANYFDGNTLYHFDELNVLPKNRFQSDLSSLKERTKENEQD